MGELFDRTAELDRAFHLPTYARKKVMFVRGEGMTLFDDDGKKYLDFTSGIGVTSLGHAHPKVAAAVAAQMTKLVHVSNLYFVEHRDELAAKLIQLFGHPGKVFFANSGAEANEGCFKLARRYGKAKRGEGASTIICANGSFHGRTLAALAATGQASKQDAFKPLPAGFKHVPLNDLEALAAAITDDVCAVMVEPIQGEGGVFPCTKEYLQGARKLCDERGVLLMFDEVQTAFYRTGTPFSFQRCGVVPDAMALAKAMANGLPIGAILAGEKCMDTLQPGEHGSTFGGGPVVCAAALATLAAHEEQKLGENATRVGNYFLAKLEAFKESTGLLTDVRGAGLMVGVTLKDPIAARVVEEARAKGFVLLNVGDSILRFLPPLVCTEK